MKSRRFLLVSILPGVLLPATQSIALSSFLSEWQTTYPTSQSDSAICQLCHQGSGGGNGWNAYGWEIRMMYIANGRTSIGDAIAASENIDSDMDPTESWNITEIIGNSQPGWTDGALNTIHFNDGSTLQNQLPPALATALDPSISGQQPNIRLTPGNLDFGVVELGVDPPGISPITIENIGQLDLIIDGVALCDGSSSDFNIPAIGNIVLSPGQQQVFDVTYSPAGDGIDSGCVEVSSDDPDQPIASTILAGHGCSVINTNLDVDVAQLLVTRDVRIGGPAIDIQLELASSCSNPSVNPVQATVTGVQNSGVVYSNSVFFDFQAPGGTQFVSLPDFQPSDTGVIHWTVTVFDGDPDDDQSTDDSNVDPVMLGDPVPVPVGQGAIEVRLHPVADGLVAPNYAIGTAALPDHLFVVDQSGQVWKINLETGVRELFLDVGTLLVPLGIFGVNSFDERGLLGVAFHPDYQNNGLLYTYTSEPVNGVADFSTMPDGAEADHQTVISEWNVANPVDPASVVENSSRRVLLTVDQPQFNHDGGGLAFGPDGFLYISLGDGGGADDADGQPFIGGDMVGHGASGNGQDATNPLGSILRIDPAGADSGNGRYGIPVDNPFIGADPRLDEIFAFGFRNPFRFSFDTHSGDLYAADVGQNDIEEVDVVTAGGNYGWNIKEGNFYFYPSGINAGYVSDTPPATLPPNLIDPVLEYDHDDGISVIGGFVYRGDAISPLQGGYVFGDWSSDFSVPSGRLFYSLDGSNIREFRLAAQSSLGLFLQGFGQDQKGELYLLGNTTGTPFGDTGVVLRIEPVSELCFPVKGDKESWRDKDTWIVICL